MFYSRAFIGWRHFESRLITTRFHRRRALRMTKKLEQEGMLGKLVSNPVINNSFDVDKLKQTILNTSDLFSPEDIDRSLITHFTNNKQFSSALSYITFLEENTKIKLRQFLTNKQFFIYFQKRYIEGSLSENDQQLIIELYQNLKKNSTVLDVFSSENVILGLSVTSKWTECLTILKDLEKLEHPSSMCYSAIIAAAFVNGREDIAWSLLDQLFAVPKAPTIVVFKAYFEKLYRITNRDEILSHLDKLFEIYGKNNLVLSEDSITDLCKLFDSSGFTYNISSVTKKGFCENCKKKLKVCEIDTNVFESMRQRFFDNVLVGKNLFAKSTPEELSRFHEFLKTLDGYDVIIDGLNVAYVAGTNQSPEICSTFLKKVVSHFVEKKKKVVVLGRKHMAKWPKKQWSYIQNNSRIFLTQDISLDDPYLLYCALHCGKDTIIVSRDLMRSHLFKLEDPKIKIMFSRWLDQRLFQLTYVNNGGTVFFKHPRPYTRIAQQNGKYWHIPYNVDEGEDVVEKWLCVNRS